MKIIISIFLFLLIAINISAQSTHIERQTKRLKIIDTYSTEERLSNRTKKIFHYELEIDLESSGYNCGNWMFNVILIEWDKETPYSKNGVVGIEIKYVSKEGHCSNISVFNQGVGKESLIIDGDVITASNFKNQREVIVSKTTEGYQLLQLTVPTNTGQKIFTFHYTPLTIAEKQKLNDKLKQRQIVEQERKLKDEIIRKEQEKNIAAEKQIQAKTQILYKDLPATWYNIADKSILNTIIKFEKERSKIKYPSENTYYIQGELKIIVDTLGKPIQVIKKSVPYSTSKENSLDKINFPEFYNLILEPAIWEGYKVKCEYSGYLEKSYKIIYTQVNYKNGQITEKGYNLAPYFLKQQEEFYTKLKEKITRNGTYLISYYKTGSFFDFKDFIEIKEK